MSCIHSDRSDLLLMLRGAACWVQALSPNTPGQGAGGRGIALASDGSVALLSGSPASGSQTASAYLYSFYTSVSQYNSCPQTIKVLQPSPAMTHAIVQCMAHLCSPHSVFEGR